MSALTILTWFLFVLSIVGMISNIQQKKICFILWALGHGGWFIVDAYSGIWAQCSLHVVSLCFCVYGWILWTKKGKEL